MISNNFLLSPPVETTVEPDKFSKQVSQGAYALPGALEGLKKKCGQTTIIISMYSVYPKP